MAVPSYTQGQKFGQYELTRFIDAGSFAEVWQAWHKGLKAHAALKILHPTITNKTTIKRFRTEAQAMYSLSETDDARARLIVKVRNVSADNEATHWMAMELLHGMNLERFCYAHAVSLHESLRISHCIALALQFAHQRTIAGAPSPIYHRDLKPGNVFYTNKGDIKVGDWGLAHVAHLENEEGGGSVIDHGTLAGMQAGTPGFTAPEQWEDITSVTGSADVYSLGVIMAVLVAEFHPGERGKLKLHDPEVQDEFLLDVPPNVRSIIVSACNVHPKKRPSVDDMVNLLADAMKEGKEETPVFLLRPGFSPPLTASTPNPPKTPAASPTLTPAPSKGLPVSEVNYGTRLDDPPSPMKWIGGGAIGVVILLIGAIVFWPTGGASTPATDPAAAKEVVEAVPNPVVVPVTIPAEVRPREEPKPETPAVPIAKIESVPVKMVETKPKADPKPVQSVPIAKAVVTEVSVTILQTQSSVKAGETVNIKAKVLLPEGAKVKSSKLFWKSDAPGAAYQNKIVTITGGFIETSTVANATLGANMSYYIDIRIEGDSKAHKSAVATTAIAQ